MQSVFKVMSFSVCMLMASGSGFVLAGDDDGADEAGRQHEAQVVGWIEKGLIMPEHTAVKIKVDSGALTSSMHAVNLETFEHKGKPWVRYDVPVKDADTGDMVTMQFERPVFRRILVRGAGGSDRRPVVKMSICMGDQVYEEQFSLRDRGDMTYPVLIGRRTIEHIGLIDVSETFLLKPSCSQQEHEEERNKQERMKDDEKLVDDSEIDQPEQTEEELEAEE
ncbi:MAG: ATP-dependent zinc protease [Halopseudomonas sp.]|uniref:retropepsin-like aspartic peptidase RloA3 n=1 Tax=Halopseudomonas sp. TaxID=2901191 RepID=UPI0030027B17